MHGDVSARAGEHYFAYGSNLNFEDWRAILPDLDDPANILRFVSTAELADYEFVFDYRSTRRGGGAANIRPARGQLVPGVIFRVADSGWSQLDSKEGAPDCYERRSAYAFDHDGRLLPVTTYQVAEKRRCGRFVRPSDHYVRVVREGLGGFGLSESMLLDAAEGQDPAPAVDALFTYGTLMRGESRRRIIDSRRDVSTLAAEVPGALLDLGSYPGMRPSSDVASRVHGELVHTPEICHLLGDLDEIEGFAGFGKQGSLFERTLVKVEVGNGRVERAWVYVLAAGNDSGTPIPSGDWRRRR